MRIGNRVFPYPVLNNEKKFSGYKEKCEFKISYDEKRTGLSTDRENLLFADLCFSLNDEKLLSLYRDGKVDVEMVVECSYTVYRKCFTLTPNPQELKIPVDNFAGGVEISAYLYASEDLPEFKSEGFSPVYSDYTFGVEKNDILAADDGFVVDVDIDSAHDGKVSSIFRLIKVASDENRIGYDMGADYIRIDLPEKVYDNYNVMKNNRDYHNIGFGLIAIPVLANCFDGLKTATYESIDDVVGECKWFRSVKQEYYRKTGTELDWDTFVRDSSFEQAQIVLNDASANAINNFADILLGTVTEGEDSDE